MVKMVKNPRKKPVKIDKKLLDIYEKIGLPTRVLKEKPSSNLILRYSLKMNGLTPSEIETVLIPIIYIPGHLVDSGSVDYPAYLEFISGIIKTPSGSILVADCLWDVLYVPPDSQDPLPHVPHIDELVGLDPSQLVNGICIKGWKDKPGAIFALEATVSFVLLIQFIDSWTEKTPWPWWPPNQP